MHSLRCTIFCLLMLGVSGLAAQTLDEEEAALLGLYGDEELISIATGSHQPITKAPAVASVITAEDIRDMGATDLDQVLETVPGLHVAYDVIGYNPIYTVRGIYSQYNPQVLFLVNGVPMQSLHTGSRHLVWGGMPVEAIQRIEVIRGPGSAVYGADAFSGVINIHTKTRRDISQTEFGVRAGSFDTQDYWALYGGDWGDLEVAAMLEFRTTDGQRERITADGATPFGISFAPGPVELSRNNLDARIDIGYKLWRLRAGLQRRRDFGLGAGLGSALDPQGRYASDRWNVDLTYDNPLFTDNWEVEGQISFRNTSQEVEEDVLLMPPGGVFPNGMIGNPEVFENHWRLDLSAFYTGFERHKVRIGAGYFLADIYKVKEEKNFTKTLAPLPGGLTDVSDDPNRVFMPEDDRNNRYLVLQDIWQFANDWELTAGVRYDNYSDFGDTVNPRLALVWSTSYNLTNKFLYGRAFRAPSFAEARVTNNPVIESNPDLDPETIQTFEWAMDYRASDELHLGANLFKYRWKDIIELDAANKFQNAGRQTGYGLELEAEWRPLHNLNISGNYAYQRSEDKETDHVVAGAPNHQLYLRADWEFRPDWNLDTRLNWVGERKRGAGDSRSGLDDYRMLDMTLRYKPANGQWELAVAGRNLFNTDAREPTTGTNAAAIPGDLPLAGRSFFVELRYRP
ncbi:MAG TPA: TonB-dependent receptor [Sedimenticola sp.]|nr:TonB-dependent receptor [Sedimenticola sp.]